MSYKERQIKEQSKNCDIRLVHFKGYLFALGYLYAKSNLALDEERWITTKHGKHIQIETETGKITKGNVGQYENPEEISSFLGQEYKGVKGINAINLLRKTENGHVKAAFTRKDIGDIDLVWGDEKAGLRHIIKQRSSKGIDVDEFLSDLPNVIENGNVAFNEKTKNFEIRKKEGQKGKKTKWKVVVVAPSYKNNSLTWILTAFKRTE